MISRVPVPTDDLEVFERALKYTLETHASADIVVLHVVGEPSPMMGKAMGPASESDIGQAIEEYTSEVLQHTRDVTDQHDTEIQYFTRPFS